MTKSPQLKDATITAVSCLLFLATAGCDKSQPAPTRTVNAATVTSPALAPSSRPLLDPPATQMGFVTSGPLVVDQQTDIVAERDGRLMEIHADIGDRIRQGQVLIVFDDRELRATRAAKAAKVESLKALEREGEAEQQGDEADLRRAEFMLKESIISQEDYEHTKFKLSKAVAETESFKADEAAAEFDLHAIDVQLEQSRIVAPFSGVVGRRNVHVSQEVKKGDPLLWLTAEGPLRVLFTVPESQMAQFPLGAPLELKTSLYPELHQVAIVHRVSPVVDPASDSVEVVGTLDHPSSLLKPGMSMQIRLNRP